MRKNALVHNVLRTCRDINTIVKSKELVQLAYALTVPAHTGTQVAINTSTYKAINARTATSILFVFVEDASDSNLIP